MNMSLQNRCLQIPCCEMLSLLTCCQYICYIVDFVRPSAVLLFVTEMAVVIYL